TGDDQPLSWMAVFQTMFCFSLQVSGSFALSARPSPCGPRNCGQFSPAKTVLARKRIKRVSEEVRMGHSITRWDCVYEGYSKESCAWRGINDKSEAPAMGIPRRWRSGRVG